MCGDGYFRIFGLVLHVVGGSAIDAGVVDAGEHQHLLMVLIAGHAWLLLLVLIVKH